MNILGERISCSPMTTRIPSSLKWLMVTYQKHIQQLTQLDAQLKELHIQRKILLERIEPLKTVIGIHEVPITATDIPSLRTKTKLSGLAYGEVTKLIYKYLGSLPEGQDASVSEIFYYCMGESTVSPASNVSDQLLLKSVRKQLKNMAYKGNIAITFSGSNYKDSRYKSLN